MANEPSSGDASRFFTDDPLDVTPAPATKMAKAAIANAHGRTYVNPDNTKATVARKKLAASLKVALDKAKKSIVAQVKAKLKGLGKAESDPDIEALIASLHIEFDEDLETELRAELADVYAAAATAALGQVGASAKQELVNQVNDRAVNWAREHAAELVNLDDEFLLGGATLDMLRATLSSGMEDGLSAELIGDTLEEAYAFSPERADLIAETEIRTANGQGALEGYRQAVDDGVVVRKSWLILEDACDDCLENEADGIIELDEQFSSGDDAPPAHPNCRCVIVPEVDHGADAGDGAGDETDISDEGDLELAARSDELRKEQEREENGRFAGGVSTYIGDDPYANSMGINANLRAGNALTDSQKATLNAVNEGILHHGRISQGEMVYRGTEDHVHVKGAGELPHPVSTSKDINVAAEFAEMTGGEKPTVYEVYVAPGTRVLDTEPYASAGMSYQKETLLESGGRMVFREDKPKMEQGVKVYRMTYVPPMLRRMVEGDELRKEQEREENGRFGSGDGSGEDKPTFGGGGSGAVPGIDRPESPYKNTNRAFDHLEELWHSGDEDSLKEFMPHSLEEKTYRDALLYNAMADEENGSLMSNSAELFDSNAQEGIGSPGFTGEETDAIYAYSETAYSDINHGLRTGRLQSEEGSNTREAQYVRGLDSAIAKSYVQDDISVYRGVSETRGNSLVGMIGKEYQDAGFVSTSSDPRSALSFSVSREEQTVLRITVEKGGNALNLNADLSANGSEREVLLPRGSAFRVDGVERMRHEGNDIRVISVTHRQRP